MTWGMQKDRVYKCLRCTKSKGCPSSPKMEPGIQGGQAGKAGSEQIRKGLICHAEESNLYLVGSGDSPKIYTQSQVTYSDCFSRMLTWKWSVMKEMDIPETIGKLLP